MSKTTMPAGGSPLDQEVAEVKHQLQSLRGAMALLRERLGQDEAQGAGSLGKALMELRQVMRATLNTEQGFDGCQKETDRDGGAERLDLDAARESIGRRLDRLRAAQGSGELSE